ncbi:hypothetical protein [Streptomyces europaeiscabiei]|uniref:hypothetical protein n=1 Tax=Streptomyces europaeiscabiei TaxID=146819 RepID=UPI0038F5DEC8
MPSPCPSPWWPPSLPVDAAAAAAPPGDGPLVPGVPPGPHQPWQVDRPDQGLPPRAYAPGAAEEALEPRSAAVVSRPRGAAAERCAPCP